MQNILNELPENEDDRTVLFSQQSTVSNEKNVSSIFAGASITNCTFNIGGSGQGFSFTPPKEKARKRIRLISSSDEEE